MSSSEFEGALSFIQAAYVLFSARTMIYISLEQALFNTSNDEFHVKTAKTVDEACKLAEIGFDLFDIID